MAAQVLSLLKSDGYDEAIGRAADALEGGGVVAFPTETVYGVGVSAANTQAMARLRAIKERGTDKPFTVHLGRRGDVDRYVPEPSAIGRRLATKGWPGPLTLIFQVPDYEQAAVRQDLTSEQAGALYHEGTIGLRCPDNRPAQELLGRVRAPVVAASANKASRPPALCVEDVVAELEDKVDVILDGGSARYAKPSTIVRVDGDRYDVIREGVFDERTLRRLASLHLLFVCTGNTCRSPMAEALCSHMLAGRLGCDRLSLAERGYGVHSAGVMAMSGAPASPNAESALAKLGVELSAHRSQPLTVDLIHQADAIYVMCGSHREAVVDLVPSAAGYTQLLGPDGDIEDPIGGDEETYLQCAERIRGALEIRLSEVLA